jgi:hypothetical protein
MQEDLTRNISTMEQIEASAVGSNELGASRQRRKFARSSLSDSKYIYVLCSAFYSLLYDKNKYFLDKLERATSKKVNVMFRDVCIW